MGDAAHAMVPFYGQGMNCVSLASNAFICQFMLWVCVCVCVRACVRACVHACVHVCVHTCMHVCVCLSIKSVFFIECYDFIVIDNACNFLWGIML